MVELTPELIKALSKTRNGFYSWDYVAGLAFWIIGVEAENERLQSRVQELEAEIKESNDLLRSAFMIAKRDGKDTNWEAWHNQLSVALARQHAMMYGKDEK